MTYNEQEAPILFNEPVAKLLAERINNSNELLEVLHLFKRMKDEGKAITINMLVENIILKRRVQMKRGRRAYFDEQETNISRGAAIKAVENLENMTLVYSEPVARTYVYYLTERGEQLLEFIEPSKAVRSNVTNITPTTFTTTSKENH